MTWALKCGQLRPGRMHSTFLAGVLILGAGTAGVAAEFPAFRHVTIDPHCGEVCYAVTLADVDGDGRQDIVAVTENRVLWYQAPGWKKRVIIEDQTERDNVCLAPFDIDGDGKIDFALGAGWTKVGTIQWLSRGESLDEPWNVHLIGKEPWLHRLRFADVLESGRPQLVISPLNATSGDGVRLTAFAIPADPHSDRWPATVLDDTLNRMHNHWHLDFDNDGCSDTLTASREGIHLVRRTQDGFSKTLINRGIDGETPDASGAGEIKTGRLANGRPYIATVEPMHGHQAVVYVKTAASSGASDWRRLVLDEELRRGHAVWCADLDGDEADELIIGHSDSGPGAIKGPGIFVFDAQDADGTRWTRHVIDDGGIATEDAICGDVTGDGRIDIVAGGRATHNVKLYVNEGPRESR